MAKYNSLGELFTAIANAIRSKTGGADPIVAEDYPTAIEGISAGGSGSADFEITDAWFLFCYGARIDTADKLIGLISDSCTRFGHMFDAASDVDANVIVSLASKLNTSRGTNFQSMFSNCYNIKEMCELDTSKATDVMSMFGGCINLKTVPRLDLNSIMPGGSYNTYNNSSLFNNCQALTNLTLYNIRRSLQIGSGTTWGHLLTVDSLVHTIQELCTVTSTQTLTMGSANLEKIAGLYCKITDDTVEKKTMELCESTDEGAMTLEEYAAAKGWAFA